MSARSARSVTSRSVPWRAGISSTIIINEGQAVKKGEVMFKILPVLYKARLDAENAKARARATEV